MNDELKPTCHKCDTRIPNVYSFSGPHIKQKCANCGVYIRFAPAVTIPSYVDSKNKIWAITQDVDLINRTKKAMGVFHSDLKGKPRDVYYHNLYVQIIMLFT